MKQYIDVLPLFSIIIPLIISLSQLLFKGKFKNIKSILTLAGMMISFICLLYLVKPIVYDNKIIIYWIGNFGPISKWAFGEGIEVDGISLILALLISIIFILTIVYSFGYFKKYNYDEKIYILMVLLMCAMFGVLFSSDLFSIYIFLEILSLIEVVLTVKSGNASRTFNSSIKLLITNSLSSFFILLGTVLLYVQVHTLNIAQISALLFSNYKEISVYALSMIFIGYAAKAFILPCAIGGIDASMKASAPITILTSVPSVIIGFYGIIRLLYFIFVNKGLWNVGKLLLIVGAIILVLSIIITVIQKKLMRAMVFLLVSQTGIILVLIGLGLNPVNSIAVTAINFLLNYIIAYVIFAMIIIFSIGSIIYVAGTDEIDKLGGLYKKMPFTFITFLIGALSIIGLPFLSGFKAKWGVIKVTNDAGFSFIGKILIAYSIALIVYFFVLIKKIFFDNKIDECSNIEEAPWFMRIPAMLMALASIFVEIRPYKFITDFFHSALYSIFNLGGYIDSVFGYGYVSDMFKTEFKMPLLNYSFDSYRNIMKWNKYIFIFAFVIVLIIYFDSFLQVLSPVCNKVKRIRILENLKSFFRTKHSKFKECKIIKFPDLKLIKIIKSNFKAFYLFLINGEISINGAVISLITCMSLMLIYTFYTLL